jgi:hypothetical protein
MWLMIRIARHSGFQQACETVCRVHGKPYVKRVCCESAYLKTKMPHNWWKFPVSSLKKISFIIYGSVSLKIGIVQQLLVVSRIVLSRVCHGDYNTGFGLITGFIGV